MKMLNRSHKNMQRTVQVMCSGLGNMLQADSCTVLGKSITLFSRGGDSEPVFFLEVADKVQERVYSQALRCGQPANWQLCFKFQSGQMAIRLG